MAKNTTKDLKRALDILTQGGQAPISNEFRLEALEMHEKSKPWTMGENIQGLGIAQRITAGKKLDEVTLKVYVDRKLPKSKVDNPVPSKLDLPGVAQTIETDVEEIGRVELEVNTSRHRPAMPGCGLAHFEVPVGTFGCLVRKKGQPDLYVLSNSHVLANQGFCKAGDVVLQAGKHDGGVGPGDVLCELVEWVPFEFTDEGFPNLVDAAIAKVRKPGEVTSAVNLLGVPKGVSRVVRRGMLVRKCGRTTDLTVGEIKDVDYRLPMSYKTPDGNGNGRVGLRDQVLCTRFTAPGDSGSAVFNMDGKIVGLHFAGSSSTSIFNKIGNVLDVLGIEIVTEPI